MKKLLLLSACVLLVCGVKAQQNSDGKYVEPLKDVLLRIQERYHVKIKMNDALVKDKFVNYAQWRFREDAETTLNNVLAPFDMKVNKEGPNAYKLKDYEYYRWEVKDGWNELDRIASKYHDKATWEQRKALLKPQIYKALELSPLPAKPTSAPIITPKRVYNGYTVENIAIEILPGLYINGSLYKPSKIKGKIPVILSPDGHWDKQRYRADCQIRCASIARMGAMAYSYDLFAWGESLLQFKGEDHRRSLAQSIQALGAIRIIDYMLTLKETDPARIGISGGSGGGSHTALMAAIDDRITLSAPVVAISSYFYGGCPCESGMPIHQCGNGTDNVEIAAMAAPHPQLLISDGSDWTANMPEHDLPYLKKMYGYYGAANLVENVHLPNDKHDFGTTKRFPLYTFLAKNYHLNIKAIQDKDGKFDESQVTVEKEPMMYVFGDKGEKLPAGAIHGFGQLEKVWAMNTQNN